MCVVLLFWLFFASSRKISNAFPVSAQTKRSNWWLNINLSSTEQSSTQSHTYVRNLFTAMSILIGGPVLKFTVLYDALFGRNRIMHCHVLGVTMVGIWISQNLLDSWIRNFWLHFVNNCHRLVPSVTVITNLLVTASKGRRSISSGFPNCPHASAMATFYWLNNDYYYSSLTDYCSNSFDISLITPRQWSRRKYFSQKSFYCCVKRTHSHCAENTDFNNSIIEYVTGAAII
jgi:hypothetical protein